MRVSGQGKKKSVAAVIGLDKQQTQGECPWKCPVIGVFVGFSFTQARRPQHLTTKYRSFSVCRLVCCLSASPFLHVCERTLVRLRRPLVGLCKLARVFL